MNMGQKHTCEFVFVWTYLEADFFTSRLPHTLIQKKYRTSK